MPAPRVAVGGFQHETGTFAPMPTRLAGLPGARRLARLKKGAALFGPSGLNIPFSGFIDAAGRSAAGWNLGPLLSAGAEPVGIIERAASTASPGAWSS